MSNQIKKSSKKKYTILFISTTFNYFINNNASFHRMYSNLRYFHRHHNFDVIVLQPSDERKKETKQLKEGINSYYFKRISFLTKMVIFTDFNPFFIFKVKEILKKHRVDLIHVDFVYGINCLKLITNIPISYNAHNVETIYYSQVAKYYHIIPFFLRYFYVKYIFLLEKYAVKHVKNINAISYIDKKKFVKIYNISPKKIIVSSIGYKKNIFDNPLKKEIARERLKINKNKFVVIFHGSYYENYANQEAIDIIKNKIVPQIKDNDINFLIAGKMPRFENLSNLKFLGYLDDLKMFLYAADIAIVPILRGSGMKTKIIDYLSANIPVITTIKGAEGLILKNGVHGYIVDDNSIEDMIEKILELKNNPNKILELKNNIWNLVIENYKWEHILEKVPKRYCSIIESVRNS